MIKAQHEADTVAIANLKTALRTSRRIGAAIGVLMATRGLTEHQAFEVLREASSDSQRKLRDIAADIVANLSAPVGSHHRGRLTHVEASLDRQMKTAPLRDAGALHIAAPAQR